MLKGTLDDFAVTDVFRLLGVPTRTGRLDLERPAGSGHVLFDGGRVVYAETSLSTSLLGQKLLATGSLTENDLRLALDERAKNGKRLGQIVVESGLVEESDLEMALREQIQDAVYELLQWETGDFTWDPSDRVEVDVEASFDVDELLAEVSRRVDEMATLQERIPSTGAIPVLSSRPPEGAEAITMTPLEWQTMVSINGTRTVSDISHAMGRSEIDTMRTLFSLVSAGLIEMKAPDGEVIPLEVVPDVPEARDTSSDPSEATIAEQTPEPEIGLLDEGPPVVTQEVPAAKVSSAEAEDDAAEEWFSDPVGAVEPMSTGEPSDLDLDSVEVSVAEGSGSGSQDPPDEEIPDVAFPTSDLPKVDRAAAARELSGLSAEESRRSRSGTSDSEEGEDDGGGLISRLIGGK